MPFSTTPSVAANVIQAACAKTWTELWDVNNKLLTTRVQVLFWVRGGG